MLTGWVSHASGNEDDDDDEKYGALEEWLLASENWGTQKRTAPLQICTP